MIAGVIVGFTAIGIAAALANAPKIASWLAERWLLAEGLGPARVEITDVGLERTKIRRVEIGKDEARLETGAVSIDYSIGATFKLRRLTVYGLRLAAAIDEKGARLPVLEKLVGPEGDAAARDSGPVELTPVDVRLTDARLALSTPAGPIAATFDGEAAVRPAGTVAARGVVGLQGAPVRAAGDLAIMYDPAGRVVVRLDQLSGAGGMGDWRASFSEGRLVLRAMDGTVTALNAVVPFTNAAYGAIVAEKGSVKIDYGGADATIEGDFLLRDGQGDGRVALTIDDIASGPRRATLEGEIRLAKLDDLTAALNAQRAIGGGGAVRFNIVADGENLAMPTSAKALLTGEVPSLRGDIALAVDRVALPGLFTAGVNGTVAIRTADGVIALEAPDGLTIGLSDIDRSAFPAYDAAVRQVPSLAGPLSISFASSGDGDPILAFDLAGAPRTLKAVAAFSLDAKGARMLDGAATVLATGGQAWSVSVPSLTVRSARVPIAGLDVAIADATLVADQLTGSARGRIDADMRIDGRPAEGVEVEGGRFALAGRFQMTEAGLRFDATRCQTMTAARVKAGALIVGADPVEICQTDAARPMAVVGADGALRFDGFVKPLAATMAEPGPGDAAPLAVVDVPRTRVSAVVSPAGGNWQVTATGAGAGARLPAQMIVVDNVAFDARLEGRAALEADVTVADARLRDLRAAPTIAPLRLDARARLAGSAARFEGMVRPEATAIAMRFEGAHDLARDSGHVEFTSDELTFAPGALQPQAIVPALRGKLTSVSGSLAVEGRADWREGTFQSGAVAEIGSLDATTAFAPIKGLSGVIEFASLVPPATKPRQAIGVDLIDIGLPLRDGWIEFALRPDGDIDLHQARWPWAGGFLQLDEVRLAISEARQPVTVTVEGVDLEELAAVLDLKGVIVTGTVNGRIPVEIEGDTVRIKNGRLATGGEGGVIRLADPRAAAALGQSGQSGALLLKALDNFRYETLQIDIDGETTGELDVRLHIRGANPDLYEGYPFELNFTIAGELVNILRQGLAGYRIPDKLRQQLQEQNR